MRCAPSVQIVNEQRTWRKCEPETRWKCRTSTKRNAGAQIETRTTLTFTIMSFDLSLPVNTALTLYILYCVQKIVFPSTSVPARPPAEFKEGYSWMPKSHPPTLLFKTYTPKTLQPFNGEEGKRILLAISGVVYDVTAGRNFYGPSK